MNFGKAIATCMGKYATFSGRASRSEYWWFHLFIVLINLGTTIVRHVMFPYGDATADIPFGTVTLIFLVLIRLIVILPSLAVAARRLHDTGRSGWWLLIAFVPLIGIILLIIWYCFKGNSGSNRFGPDPLISFDDTRVEFHSKNESSHQPSDSSTNNADQIRQLHKLKEEGVISEHEFQSKKDAFLKNI